MILYEHFDYEGVVAEADLHPDQLWVHARAVVGSDRKHIVGTAPSIRFWREQMVLIAAQSENPPLKWYAYPVGDVMLRAARPGDTLRASQDTSGRVRLWLLRNGQLVIAVGALCGVDLEDPSVWVESSRPGTPPLGRTTYLSQRAEALRQPMTVPVRRVENLDESSLARILEPPPEPRAVDVQIGTQWRTVGELRSVTLEGYDVFVETAARGGKIAISRTDDEVIVNAARRSAVIMGFYLDSLRGERRDGRFIKYPEEALASD
jgi:hypothetical protein